MNEKSCPICHTSIPEHAPGGLCPACVLRGADEPEPGPSHGPTLEEVAAAFPKLEILRLIGHGGMGYVYQARQPELDRMVALKILSPSLRSDPAFEERFAREARVLGKLKHPNIVTLYEHGESGGYFYLLMEFIDGVNLRQAMSAGRFSPEQALAIVPAICDALQSAHALGVWHRDIKPENILLDRDGRVKIADFGIARILGDPERNFTLTRTGGLLGSAAYMAPEQHEKPHDVDHRADIYSLGVVIYEMLTGELPLGRFPLPSQRAEVGKRIDEIVLRTLEKERELRQQSADEVRTEVEASGSPATSGSIGRRVNLTFSRTPWILLITGVVLLLVFSLTTDPFIVSHFWRKVTDPSFSSTTMSSESDVGNAYLHLLRLWFGLGLALALIGTGWMIANPFRRKTHVNSPRATNSPWDMDKKHEPRPRSAGEARTEVEGAANTPALATHKPAKRSVAKPVLIGCAALLALGLLVLLVPLLLLFSFRAKSGRAAEEMKRRQMEEVRAIQEAERANPEAAVRSMIEAAKRKDAVAFKRGISDRLLERTLKEDVTLAEPMRDWARLTFSAVVSKNHNHAVVLLDDREKQTHSEIPLVWENGSWKVDVPKGEGGPGSAEGEFPQAAEEGSHFEIMENAATTTEPMPEIIVNVLEDGSLRVEGATVDLKQLGEKMSMIVLKSKDQPVRIRSDSKVPYKRLLEVIGACQLAGIWNISFASGLKGEPAEGGESPDMDGWLKTCPREVLHKSSEDMTTLLRNLGWTDNPGAWPGGKRPKTKVWAHSMTNFDEDDSNDWVFHVRNLTPAGRPVAGTLIYDLTEHGWTCVAMLPGTFPVIWNAKTLEGRRGIMTRDPMENEPGAERLRYFMWNGERYVEDHQEIGRGG